MARALVLGEDDVAPEDRRAFRRSGLAHLLAVSGMHLVIVAVSIVSALRALLLRMPALAVRWDVGRFACAAGIPLVWIYADLAGGSGSAVRAAWMMSAALVARVLGRRPDAWRSAGLAAVAMAIGDPLAAFDPSFVLSALATAGLLALARPIEGAIERRVPRLPAFVRTAVSATAAATIACTPVLACMAPDLSLGSIVANVVAVPLGEAAALPLCLAHAVLAPWPAAERGCAIAASGALAAVRAVAHAFAWAVVRVPSPTAAELAALVSGASLLFVARRFSRMRVVLATVAVVLLLEAVVRVRAAPRGVVRATFVDVGQGDAALIDLPDGSAMMIDGGGIVGSPVDVGERAIAPLLRARRRGRIDVVVLSHPHPDHFLGLASALEGIEVGAIWDTGQGESEGAGPAYDALLAAMRARGVPVLRPADLCGTRRVGGAIVEVLAPCPGIDGDHGANDNSFVLRLRHGARALLFAGDAERFEEGVLLARDRAAVQADVLKVGHHGSRTSSTPAFVGAVAPRVAVVSCGIRNRFGHPHPSTIEALLGAGVLVHRTDRDGTVIVTTDGASLDVETAQPRSTTPMNGRLR
jgi:competence protein ComEC